MTPVYTLYSGSGLMSKLCSDGRYAPDVCNRLQGDVLSNLHAGRTRVM